MLLQLALCRADRATSPGTDARLERRVDFGIVSLPRASGLAEAFDESVADPLTPLQRAMAWVREQEDALQIER